MYWSNVAIGFLSITGLPNREFVNLDKRFSTDDYKMHDNPKGMAGVGGVYTFKIKANSSGTNKGLIKLPPTASTQPFSIQS